MMVYIVVFDKSAFQINPKLYVNVKKYIVDHGNKDEFNEDTASDELDYGFVRRRLLVSNNVELIYLKD